MKPMTIAAAALAWTMAATGAAGQECEASEADCFALWNGCEPIRAIISFPAPEDRGDGDAIGLQMDDVSGAVAARLRAARIYHEGEGALEFLVVGALVVGPAYAVDVGFYKAVLRDTFRLADGRGGGVTWPWLGPDTTIGTHGGRASEVMEVVRGKLDQFMNDYLRVNGPACEAR